VVVEVNRKMAQVDRPFLERRLALKNRTYNIVYSNVFSTFIYYGQQHIFSSLLPSFDVDANFNYPYVNVNQSQKKHSSNQVSLVLCMYFHTLNSYFSMLIALNES